MEIMEFVEGKKMMMMVANFMGLKVRGRYVFVKTNSLAGWLLWKTD